MAEKATPVLSKGAILTADEVTQISGITKTAEIKHRRHLPMTQQDDQMRENAWKPVEVSAIENMKSLKFLDI